MTLFYIHVKDGRLWPSWMRKHNQNWMSVQQTIQVYFSLQ